MADLSIAKECDILLTAEQVWADSQSQNEMYSADAETIKALKEQQTGRTDILTKLEDPALEDDEITVTWIDFCETPEPEDCTSVCDFEGEEPELDSVKYKLDLCKELTFSLDENSLLRNKYTFEEVSAKGLLNLAKSFDEYLNRQSLLFLSANAGLNKGGAAGTFVGSTLEVDPANYNEDLLIDMVMDAKLSKMNDAFLIDSGALYRAFMKSQLESGNADGKGSFAKSQLFKTYFDLIGFPTAPVTDTSFVVSPYAYAVANRAYNPSSPTEFQVKNLYQIRSTFASRNIPGIVYDVYHQTECSGRRKLHTWKMQVNWKFLLNPLCASEGQTVTGILSYTKETPST